MASEKCAIGILLGRADCDDTTITQRWRQFFSGFGGRPVIHLTT